MSKIAIMQPYFLPYLGYFHLIKSVDVFVFYDDVHFVKKGWINRNRILFNQQEKLISVPLVKPSQNKLINESMLNTDDPMLEKLLKTFEHAYRKAPYFESVASIFTEPFKNNNKSISELNIDGIQRISQYLNIDIQFKVASKQNYNNNHLTKGDRLIDICKQEGINEYINAAGGREIYSKEVFAAQGVNLSFISSSFPEYKQINNSFVPELSMIDLLMFLAPEEVQAILEAYELN